MGRPAGGPAEAGGYHALRDAAPGPAARALGVAAGRQAARTSPAMTYLRRCFVSLFAAALAGQSAAPLYAEAPARSVDADPRERHLTNVRQLTFAGENAEAYWSLDGEWISMQATRDGAECDRIYRMRPDGSQLEQVSTGFGRTTCAYYLDAEHIVYASTFLGGAKCPPKPDRSQGYVWPLYDSFDLFVRRADGGGLRRLTHEPGYDAEATVRLDGGKIVFTSLRTGDPELFVMNPDGSGLQQLTDAPGYDGGAFFTPDGKQIVWRRSDPKGQKLVDYRRLLGQGLVRPSEMDLWVMDADGSNKRLVLANGAANFAPYGMPDNSGMLFSSNLGDPKGRNFDIYFIRYDGTGLEQITFYEGFDGFPIFDREGQRLLFSSNRFGAKRGDTNVFLADWLP